MVKRPGVIKFTNHADVILRRCEAFVYSFETDKPEDVWAERKEIYEKYKDKYIIEDLDFIIVLDLPSDIE